MDPIVELSGLEYRYPDGRQALAGVDLTVAGGESVALLGPNGAGKSTLFLVAAGLIAASGGRMSLFGRPRPDQAAFKDIRSQLGLVFQNPDEQLFTSRVIDDVAFGPLNFGLPEAEAEQQARRALNVVGLEGYEDRIPHHLSGGEKRRVCLASVLSGQPRLLLLDEPSSNLDPRGRGRLIDLLNAIPLTKIIATHDLELAVACCPRAVVLDQGRVTAQGATREILSNHDLVVRHGLEVPHSLDRHHQSPDHSHAHPAPEVDQPGATGSDYLDLHEHFHAHRHVHPHQGDHVHPVEERHHHHHPIVDRSDCSTWNIVAR